MPKIKCATYDPRRKYRYAHLKRDGLFVRRRADGRFETSNPTDITEKCMAFEWARQMPPGLTICGELWAPGYRRSDVKTLLNAGDKLRFSAFCVESWDPMMDLEDVERGLAMEFIPYTRVELPVEELFDASKRVYGPDIEGFVFKDGNIHNWAKWKPVRTIDLVVTDFEDGSGKYIGMIGSLICSLADGTPIARVSGMNDAERTAISLNEESYLGKVVEVEYQMVGARGRLVHPRFVRWREDKLPAECTRDQDEDL